MEASALQAPAALARSRLSIGSPLLRLRSDEQLVALFRGGNEEAFRVIHDRYRQRLFAYARQMLPGQRQDAEDALQDIFVRAYAGLRASDRELALRAWLYRVAHNRCVDELRRAPLPPPELLEVVRPPSHDPIAEAERRESLRGLVADIRRLPEQQRSALLMRELGGMAYTDLAAALGVSVPAVKSLLVRARIGLARAMQARDTECEQIREELASAYDRGVRPSGIARRHMHDCAACRDFRRQIRGTSRQLAALVPVGPLALLTNLFGFGGSATGGGAAGGGAAAAGGVAGTTGAVATLGAVAGGTATHLATIIAAAVVTAGGAVEIQRSVSPSRPPAQHGTVGAHGNPATPASGVAGTIEQPGSAGANAPPGTGTRAAAARAHATPGTSSDSGALTAGPGIPAVDQLNPAAIAAGQSSATATGTPASGTSTTGSSAGGAAPGSGTTQPTNGDGSASGDSSTGVGASGTGPITATSSADGSAGTSQPGVASGTGANGAAGAGGSVDTTGGSAEQAQDPNAPSTTLAGSPSSGTGANASPAFGRH